MELEIVVSRERATVRASNRRSSTRSFRMPGKEMAQTVPANTTSSRNHCSSTVFSRRRRRTVGSYDENDGNAAGEVD